MRAAKEKITKKATKTIEETIVTRRLTRTVKTSKDVNETVEEEVEPESDMQELPPLKRKQATCSYCHNVGHINKMTKKGPVCPKRREEFSGN